MTAPLQERIPGLCRPRGTTIERADRLGTVDGFPVDIQQPDLTEYTLGYDWPNGGRIAQLRITAAYGIGACSVLINDVVVAGIDHAPISANARSQHNATGDNVFAAGDDLILRVDSGADTLLGLRGTLVVTNKSLFEPVRELPSGLVTGEIPITADLIDNDLVVLEIVPPLRRRPTHIFEAVVIKNSPEEPNVFQVAIEPLASPDDFTKGWVYRLSAGAIEGQRLRYAYIK